MRDKLHFVMNFPKDEKYVSILAKEGNLEHVERKRERVKKKIKQRLVASASLAEANEGGGEVAEAAAELAAADAGGGDDAGIEDDDFFLADDDEGEEEEGDEEDEEDKEEKEAEKQKQEARKRKREKERGASRAQDKKGENASKPPPREKPPSDAPIFISKPKVRQPSTEQSAKVDPGAPARARSEGGRKRRKN